MIDIEINKNKFNENNINNISDAVTVPVILLIRNVFMNTDINKNKVNENE